MLKVKEIRMDYERELCGTDHMPGFGWVLTSDQRNVKQEAYQLQIAEDETFEILVFDSGVVESEESAHVKVKGVSLKSLTDYYVRVQAKAAGEVITEERIRNDIGPDAIYVEGAPVNGRQIVDDSQFVIIPSLTINTAAKVANCISDNLLTNMISRAMATGKPIVAAIDGCCPDNKVREQLGFKVTEAYKAKMRHNLEDMLAYGITLTTDYSLCSKVNEVFSAKVSLPALDNSKPAPKKDRIVSTKMEPAVQSVSQPVKKVETPSSVKLDKKVIGRVDIAKNARFKTIVVRQDALVTGLAKDEALNRGITIVKE